MRVLGIAGNLGSGKDAVADELVARHGFVRIAFADAIKRLAKTLFDFSDETLWGSSACRNAVDPRGGLAAYWEGVDARVRYVLPLVDMLFHDMPGPGMRQSWHVASAFNRFLDDVQAQGAALTPRYTLQRFGTEFGRALWPRVWVHTVETAIRILRAGGGYTKEGGPCTTRGVAAREPKGVCVTDSRFPDEAAEVRAWGGRMVWIDASTRSPLPEGLRHSSEPARQDFRVMDGDLIDYDLDNNGAFAALPGKVNDAVARLFQ